MHKEKVLLEQHSIGIQKVQGSAISGSGGGGRSNSTNSNKLKQLQKEKKIQAYRQGFQEEESRF